jgi:hypothetical protein
MLDAVAPIDAGKTTMSWTDWRGNKITEQVNTVADARNVVGLAGYPWIIMAANPQLSNVLIERYLEQCGIDGVERSRSWIQRRRWMFRRVPQGNAKGPRADIDGNEARALRIMREHPKLSAPQLSYLLEEHGIKRGATWVRTHRVDARTNSRRSI